MDAILRVIHSFEGKASATSKVVAKMQRKFEEKWVTLEQENSMQRLNLCKIRILSKRRKAVEVS